MTDNLQESEGSIISYPRYEDEGSIEFTEESKAPEKQSLFEKFSAPMTTEQYAKIRTLYIGMACGALASLFLLIPGAALDNLTILHIGIILIGLFGFASFMLAIAAAKLQRKYAREAL